MFVDRHLTRQKRPGEAFALSWDFVNDVDDGDDYASCTVVAYDAEGVDVTSSIVNDIGRVGTTGVVVGCHLHAGLDKKDYFLAFSLTTVAGRTFIRVLSVQVRA